MPKYTETQLSKMAVNPSTVGRMVDAYPYLGVMLHDAELTHGDDEDKLLRYAAYVYDPASPMVREFPDPRERKKHAAELVKYKYSERHLRMVVSFLKNVVRSLEWRVICAKEHAFGEYEDRVYDAIQTDGVKDTDIIAAATKKDLLIKQMKEIAMELPSLKEHFWGGDTDLITEADRKVFTSEAVAARVTKK